VATSDESAAEMDAPVVGVIAEEPGDTGQTAWEFAVCDRILLPTLAAPIRIGTRTVQPQRKILRSSLTST
jgi:hypothetical protein